MRENLEIDQLACNQGHRCRHAFYFLEEYIRTFSQRDNTHIEFVSFNIAFFKTNYKNALVLKYFRKVVLDRILKMQH